MKVLFIMNQVDKGGAALAFIELVLNIHKKYDVECVVLTGGENRINHICNDHLIENHTAHFKNFMTSPIKPRFIFRYIIGMRNRIGSFIANIECRNLDFNSFDLIYTNLDRIDFGANLSLKYNKPHVWHIREHLQGDFEVVSLMKNYVRYMERFDSEYVAVSESVMNAWIKRGIRPDRIHLIYDGVETERIKKKSCWFINDKVHLLFMGGITESKGQRRFLECISGIDNEYKKLFDITFFGNGSKNDKLELLKIAEDNHVCCFVHDYDNDIYSKICNYDVGITYSIAEGFGRVTVEYMAAGLCVIATDSGANPELISDGKDGYLISAENGETVKDLLIKLLKNRNTIILVGKNANSKSEQFSMTRHVDGMYRLFQDVLEAKT